MSTTSKGELEQANARKLPWKKVRTGCLYGCGGTVGLVVLIFILGLVINMTDPEGVKRRKKERKIAEAAEAAKATKEPKPIELIDPTSFTAARGSSCGNNGKVTQTDFAVAEEDTFRSQPRADAAPTPFKVGDEEVPAPLELSASLRELCRAGDWSEVRVLSLTDHELQGWVPSKMLRKVPVNAKGRRIYEARDFEWPKDSSAQRGTVVKIVNRIMDQRPECLAMDTKNLTLIGPASRGTFGISCFVGKDMISFEFRAADAASGRSFERVEPMEETDAVTMCRIATEQSAMHPSTVDFEMRYEFDQGNGDGRTQVRQPFTAKNSFGLELRHQAICDFSGKILESISFKEIP